MLVYLLVLRLIPTHSEKAIPTMALTDTAIKAIKQDVRPKKYSDANGLFLLVQPNGSKLWRYAYRYLGKQKTLSLGA